MPLIVQPEHYHWWVSGAREREGIYEAVLNHPDKEELYSQPVSWALNNVRNESAELLKAATEQKQG